MTAVTVLLPAYNAAAYVAQAVESVLGQSFQDFELLVINDGSTDDTGRIVQSFSDARLRYVEQPNAGLVATLNRGLEMASAPLVARMDADDIAYPQRLARQVAFLRSHPKVNVVGTGFRLVDADGEPMFPVEVLQRDFDIRRDMFLRNPFAHPTVMLLRDAVLAVGGYRPMRYGEDYDLWRRLTGYANLPDVLLDYRIVMSSMSRTLDDNQADVIRDALWAAGRPPHLTPWQVAASVWTERHRLRFYVKQAAKVERERWRRARGSRRTGW